MSKNVTVQLTYNELCTVLDVVNVYTPQDIESLYPEMGKKEFMNNVNSAFKKLLDSVKKGK
tara:strand:+ start:959 stop:1141 length:183 start_codon:yes stop_codon:yes gene_type:complete